MPKPSMYKDSSGTILLTAGGDKRVLILTRNFRDRKNVIRSSILLRFRKQKKIFLHGFHGEVLVLLELCGMRTTPSLSSLPGSLWPGPVAPDRVPSVGQIELNCVLMLN